jgi:hypothetical protein
VLPAKARHKDIYAIDQSVKITDVGLATTMSIRGFLSELGD